MMEKKGYCPVCNTPVFSLSIQGPGSARAGPCGHDFAPGVLLSNNSISEEDETNEVVDHNADASGPNDVRVAYVTTSAVRSWALHTALSCPLLEGRGREGQPVDPAAFPFLGWCAVCSPWLKTAQPGRQS